MDESFTLYGGDGIQRAALRRLFPSQLDYPAPPIDQLGLLSTSTIIEETGDMGERGRVIIERTGGDWKFTYPDNDVALWSTICDLLISMRDTWSVLGPAVREVAGLLSVANGEPEVAVQRGVALQRSAFVLEAAEQYLVQLGHLMTNAALRMAVDHPDDRKLLNAGTRKQKEVFEAAETNNLSLPAWPFHRFAVEVRKLLRTSTTGGASCIRSAADVVEMPSWAAVLESRHQWFHRARSYAMGDRGELVSLESRFREMTTALHDGRHALREFALGCDDASPRCEGLLLLARTTVQVFDSETGQITDAGSNVDLIRECL